MRWPRVAGYPAQGPVETPARRRAFRKSHARSSFGTPKPPRGPLVVAAKTVVTTSPSAVDHRPARVAGAHRAAQGRDRAAHRPAPVGVLGDDLARLPEPAGAHVERPVDREAEDRRRRPRLRVVGQRQRRRAQPGHAQHRDVVARVERDGAAPRSARPRPRSSTRVSLLPGHHVRVGHHQPGARPPSRSPRSPARRRCRGSSPRWPRAARTPSVAGDRGRRRRHARLRAVDPRERVEPGERVDQPAGRRQDAR